MNILYITNIPSPYIVDFLNELGKKANVHAVFERASSSERDISWDNFRAKSFTYRILNGINYDVDKAVSFGVIREIKKHKKWRVILSNPITISGIIAICYLKLCKIPYALQVEGGISKPTKGIKKLIKQFSFSGASHYYTSGEITEQYLISNGADPNKFSRYPFTSIHSNDIYLPSDKDKEKIRNKLEIPSSFVLITVSQFIYRKGIDILLEAIGQSDKNIRVYIIGGKPTKEYLDIIHRLDLDNVHFLDFQPKEQVLNWMRAADAFIMPTRYDIWGLVVNEAMSQGLPVIASDGCVAAKEMIHNGKNGYIFENENVNMLANYIRQIVSLENSDELRRMKLAAVHTAQEYTYEKMAESHLNSW